MSTHAASAPRNGWHLPSFLAAFLVLLTCLAWPGPAALAQADASPGSPIQLAPPPAQPQVSDAVPPVPSGDAASSGGAPPAPWLDRQTSDATGRACLISKEDGGFRITVTASSSAPGTVTFTLERSDWSFAPATRGPVKFAFDDGATLTGIGTEISSGISLNFDATTLRPWMHHFTSAGLMTVSAAGGAVPAVPISLAGTTPAITAMSNCVKSTGLQDVPPPFTTVSTALSGDLPPARRVGPSMPCLPPSRDALVLLSCSDDDLARADIAMVQTYYALRGSTDPGALKPLKSAFLDMVIAARQSCGLPPVQPTEDQSAVRPPPFAARCIAQAYDRQRGVWLSKLSGPALDEASRPPGNNIALQAKLQSLGFVPATETIDGVFGTGTRDAIRRWQQSSNRPVTGFLSDGDAQTLLPGGGSGADASTPTRTSQFEVKPLATAALGGKPITIAYDGLSVAIDREHAADPDVCTTEPKRSIGVDGRGEAGAAPTSGCDALVGRVSLNGKLVHVVEILPIDDKTDWSALEGKVTVRRLDAKTSAPQIVFTAFSGGAHCCTSTLVTTQGADSAWRDVPIGSIDGDQGYGFVDPARTGVALLAGEDGSFNYAFSSYAGSYAPTRLLAFSDTKTTDVTNAPVNRPYVEASLADMEGFFQRQGAGEVNGYYAGWVATEALLGQFDDAWKTVLEKYDRSATVIPSGPDSCKLDPSRLPGDHSCPPGDQVTDPYPQALATLLKEDGYISDAQARSIGFDVDRIETDRDAARKTMTGAYLAQPYHGWFRATRNGSCVPADHPGSPASLIEEDRQEGWEDEVSVVKSDDDGNPTVVRVARPEGNDLVNISDFFHSEAICDARQQDERDKLDQLR